MNNRTNILITGKEDNSLKQQYNLTLNNNINTIMQSTASYN